jgi:peptidoglycan hydrolase-like protein with peptidoglycan-binding domain
MRNISVKLAGAFVAVAFAFSASSALALTQAQTDSIIGLLEGFGVDAATVANVRATLSGQPTSGGGSSSGSSSAACGPYTSDLTMGSTGPQVINLQTYLVDMGFLTIPAGVNKGYFGSLTQAALANYQAANNVLPSVGYFGPLTRASVAANCGGSTTTGGGTTTTTTTTSSKLEGVGAGSVDTYTLTSGISGEEVGEGENDVEVAGIDIEVSDSSDLEIKAVKLVFAGSSLPSGDSQNFNKYADEVSVWFDGKKVAKRDANKFTDDNSFTQTLTLDSGAIVRAGDEETLKIAVSGINNLDSADAGNNWTVDTTSIRWMDAQGTTVSEDPSVATRTFSFETFQTSSNSKLKITAGDHAINDGMVIVSDATNAKDNVEVFAFDVEIEGTGTVRVDDFSIEATVTGAANFDEIADQITLYVDGDKIKSVSVPANEDTILFDDLNLDLEPGDYEFVFKADLLAVSGALDDGDTFLFAIGETETDLATTDIDDANGEALTDANITGSVTSSASAIHSVAINVALVSASATAANNDTAADDDVGTFTMKFDITAAGGTVYVGDTAIATTVADGSVGVAVTDAILYRIYDSGTATTDDESQTVTWTKPGGVTDTGTVIEIQEGSTSRATLTVQQTNVDSVDDGIWYMDLAGVAWGIANDSTFEYVYTYNLDEFETNTISLN